MKRNLNAAGLQLCKTFESFRSKPYICPAGVPTIGFGTTRYPSGKKVSINDKAIDEATAAAYLLFDMRVFESAVDTLCRSEINGNQFSALVSLVYNIGATNFKGSTLLRKVNANPNDPSIKNEFLKWVYGGDGTKNRVDDDGDGLIDEPGEKLRLPGLVRRRTAEANLYFTQL